VSKFRRPHGKLVQQTPDWFIDRMMGGVFIQAANATNNSFVGLYNNSTAGEFLHVWSIHVWVQTATTFGNCKLFNGIQGSLIAGATTPLNPLAPQRGGVIYAGSLGAVGGNNMYALSGNNNPTDWYAGYAFCVLPPGWGLYVASGAINTAVLASFMWCAMGSEEGFT
jgi:hypothetical protein